MTDMGASCISLASIERIAQENLPDVVGTVERWVRGDEPVWAYARCIEDWGPEFEMYRMRWSRRSDGDIMSSALRSAIMVEMREQFLKRFGYMLPCADILDELQKSDLVVEIGAGSGYMTRIMRNRGINVIGSDPGLGYAHCITHAQYDGKQIAAQGKTMVRRYPDALIFCSWPSLSETWFRQALKAMRVGQRIVTVLEDSCAEESARAYFDACFEVEKTIHIPAFQFMNDIAYVAIKKRAAQKSVAPPERQFSERKQ